MINWKDNRWVNNEIIFSLPPIDDLKAQKTFEKTPWKPASLILHLLEDRHSFNNGNRLKEGGFYPDSPPQCSSAEQCIFCVFGHCPVCWIFCTSSKGCLIISCASRELRRGNESSLLYLCVCTNCSLYCHVLKMVICMLWSWEKKKKEQQSSRGF